MTDNYALPDNCTMHAYAAIIRKRFAPHAIVDWSLDEFIRVRYDGLTYLCEIGSDDDDHLQFIRVDEEPDQHIVNVDITPDEWKMIEEAIEKDAIVAAIDKLIEIRNRKS